MSDDAEESRMSDRLVIEVGLPDPCLNPNKSKSTHWAKLGRERKKLRDTVYNTIRILNPEFVDACWESATIQYDFYHENCRKRDDDNFRTMMKSARDAFGLRNNFADVLGGLYMAEEWGVTRETFDPDRMQGKSTPTLETKIGSNEATDEPELELIDEEPERDPDTGEEIPPHIGKRDELFSGEGE